jgi:hypothetical protein
MMIPDPVLIFVICAVVVLFGYIAPIMIGVTLFQRKGYSPHWMWFGIHPIGGWVAALVAVCLQKRRQCPNCGGFVEANFWLCPYCGEELLPRKRPPFDRRWPSEMPDSDLPPVRLGPVSVTHVQTRLPGELSDPRTRPAEDAGRAEGG